jgi:hypothetical protein
MLLAEIHGKRLEEARNNEDYLTSAVFGHLRYVPPGPFWDDLLSRARGLPESGGQEPFLGRVLARQGLSPGRYATLQVQPWRSHPTHGEPDILLVFSARGLPTLVVLVEAKLWAAKSGTGDYDQLVRYLRILDDPAGLGLCPGAVGYLVYLTPRESLAEVQDSAALLACPAGGRGRLFRLRWQDVAAAAAESSAGASEPARTILTDVKRFLQGLGLEYFDGFHATGSLPALGAGEGHFYTTPAARFRGFTEVPLPGHRGLPVRPFYSSSRRSFRGFTEVALPTALEVCAGGWVR